VLGEDLAWKCQVSSSSSSFVVVIAIAIAPVSWRIWGKARAKVC
jgi:hypothetical protein